MSENSETELLYVTKQLRDGKIEIVCGPLPRDEAHWEAIQLAKAVEDGSVIGLRGIYQEPQQ